MHAKANAKTPKALEMAAQYATHLRRAALAMPRSVVGTAMGKVSHKTRDLKDSKAGSLRSDWWGFRVLSERFVA